MVYARLPSTTCHILGHAPPTTCLFPLIANGSQSQKSREPVVPVNVLRSNLTSPAAPSRIAIPAVWGDGSQRRQVWLAMTRPVLRRQPLSQKMCLQRKSHLGSEEAKVLYFENREQSSSHPPSSLPTLSAKYEALVKSEGHLGDDEKTTGE